VIDTPRIIKTCQENECRHIIRAVPPQDDIIDPLKKPMTRA
jgi:hypothetical protein